MTTAIGTTVTAGTWAIDPQHTEIGFTVRHLMSKVRGSFPTTSGTVVTTGNLAETTVSIEVDLSSIETGSEQRDAHLRTGDFFGVETHPTMTFTSTGVRENGDRFVLTGDLAIRGITKSVDLDVEFLGEGQDPWGGTRLGVEASGTINRNDFGISWNTPIEGSDRLLLGDTITLNLAAQAVLQS